ncbi:MAG: xanthine dehydrogenase family protein molybdopterin-binding subunit [Candidatus Caldarchaeum sp.]
MTRRVEDLRLITGSGTFVDDLKLPRMAYAVFVRSPHAHAFIKSIDSKRAELQPDVLGVFTGADFKQHMKPLPQATGLELNDYCIAVDEVVHYGQPVAAVVAHSYSSALDAAEYIEVEYELLKPVISMEEALADVHKTHKSLRSNVILSRTFTYGDLDQALRNADFIIEETFNYRRHSATPLECYAVIADYNRSTKELMLIDNCQLVSLSVNTISNVLSLSPKKIRLVRPDIGGGFGIKSMVVAYEPLIAVLSKLTGRPIKWIETRREHLSASAHGSERIYRCQAACDSTGRIRALRIAAYDDAGAFVRPPGSFPISCLRAFNGPYDIKAFEYNINLVLTNKCPAGPSRGNAKNHHSFVLERLVQRISQRTGLDPIEVRLKNLITPEQFPYVSANRQVYDSGNYIAALRYAAKLIGYEEFRKKQLVSWDRGCYTGIGLAVVVDPAGANSAQQRLLNDKSQAIGSSDAVKITIENTGVIRVYLGTIPQGQGHETVATEIVSERLGIPADKINVAQGFDSLRDPWTPTSGTYSSRFAGITVNALILACEKLKSNLVKIASRMLDAPPEILRFEEGKIYVEDKPSKSVELDVLAKAVYVSDPQLAMESLEATVVYSHNFGQMGVSSEENLSTTYGYQVHAVVIEVDAETGGIKIKRYVVVDDCGRVLNDVIKDGQVHGGVFTGVASALYERLVYDEDGQLLTSTFMDFLAPTAVEIPQIEVKGIETPSPLTLAGSKGIGETGALAPQAAIINALEDALSIHRFKADDSYVDPFYVWLRLRKVVSS